MLSKIAKSCIILNNVTNVSEFLFNYLEAGVLLGGFCQTNSALQGARGRFWPF